jgi:hypothetical protein
MKIIVYSCNVGNYDNPIKDGRLYLEGGDKFNSDRLNSKIVKVLSHLFLPEHDYSIWVDANIELLITPKELVELMGDYECMVFKHPKRENINQEIIECGLKDTEKNKQYHKNKPGLLAACGIVVRKNTETVNRLNEKWWAEICRGSFRDQLSFPYTLGTISKYIKTEWRKPFNSKYTKWHPHNKNTKNEDISDKKKQIELDYIIKNFY